MIKKEKKCNQCQELKLLENYGNDKSTKDNFKNKCKECEKKNRDNKKGKETKKNINNINDANKWVKDNFPNYEVLKWGGSSSKKSLFKDNKRNIEFEYSFSVFKDKIQEFPDRIFGATKEERQKKLENSMIEIHGAKYALQVPKFKNKQENTLLKNYGVNNAMNSEELKEKQINSLNENYGVINPMKSKEIKERATKTMVEKYGVKHPMQNEEIKDKIKNTNIIKYGGNSPASDESITKKGIEAKIIKGSLRLFNNKTLKENYKNTEFSYSYFQQLVSKYGFDYAISAQKKASHIEEVVKKYLLEQNSTIIHDKYINNNKKYRPDFIIEDKKLIIECDGLYWHSDQIIKDSKYHFDKNEYYNQLGYSSLFFREDEIRDKFHIVKSIISNKLGKSQKIFARKCNIKKVDKKIGRDYLNQNHLMNNGQGDYLGLYYDSELVCIIQIKWKNKNKKILDISRFCPKLNHSIVGGWSKLIKHIIKEESPNKIMTFIDQRYGSGKYLEKLGWKKETNYPSFKWTDGKYTTHRMRYEFNSGYENGLAKIWDCGQSKYIYNNIN